MLDLEKNPIQIIYSDDRIAPTHVKENYLDELDHCRRDVWPQEVLWQWGNLVLTLYWDKTFLRNSI